MEKEKRLEYDRLKSQRYRQREGHKDRWRVYQQEHRQEWREYVRRHAQKIKLEVLTHYGNGKCACVTCGESRLACLSIDHINGNGNLQLKELRKAGVNFYRWLRKNNYPKGYQTLCMNCQWVKRAFNNEVKTFTMDSKN